MNKSRSITWWDREPTGIRVRRKAIIGTIQQYPNVEDAWQASNGLRVSINEARKVRHMCLGLSMQLYLRLSERSSKQRHLFHFIAQGASLCSLAWIDRSTSEAVPL